MDFDTKILAVLALLALIILFFDLLGFGMMGVVSNSMNHQLHDRDVYLEFWEAKGHNESSVERFPLADGFWGGDLLVYKKTETVVVGDVGVYHSTCAGCEDDVSGSRECRLCTTIVVHRVSSENSTHVSFKADNARFDDVTLLQEERIPRSLVLGKVLFHIPKTGLLRSLPNCWLKNLKGDTCSSSACLRRGECN